MHGSKLCCGPSLKIILITGGTEASSKIVTAFRSRLWKYCAVEQARPLPFVSACEKDISFIYKDSYILSIAYLGGNAAESIQVVRPFSLRAFCSAVVLDVRCFLHNG